MDGTVVWLINKSFCYLVVKNGTGPYFQRIVF